MEGMNKSITISQSGKNFHLSIQTLKNRLDGTHVY